LAFTSAFVANGLAFTSAFVATGLAFTATFALALSSGRVRQHKQPRQRDGRNP
jgi:hypothetical protein